MLDVGENYRTEAHGAALRRALPRIERRVQREPRTADLFRYAAVGESGDRV